MKRIRMMQLRNKTLLGIGAVCGFAVGAPLLASAGAEQQLHGAQLLMKHVTNRAQIEDLKPGDAVAMACAKCKCVMVQTVTTEKGHIQVMTVGSKHQCPGCGGTITTVESGDGKVDSVKHACEKCGNDSVFCCATSQAAGQPRAQTKSSN